jgi:HAT1-interacting factor 1
MAEDAPPAAVDEAAANTADQDAAPEDLDSMPPQDQLAHLTARATAEYAVKHYSEAAELYSQASEIQAELNGDMAVENADLLFAYGKCLFFLAQQTSSVLGGTAAAGQLTNKQKEGKPKKKKVKAETNGGNAGGEASSSAVVKESDIKPEADKDEDGNADLSKPFFQISGDTADWSSDEDEPEPNEAEEEEEEEDDFANSYELLDLARILYLRKLESLPPTTDSTPTLMDPLVRETKSRIAEIHDLQSEVLLESEKYALAAEDLSKALALREELDPPESALLAECHYKLSLALEFASQSQQRDNDGNPVGDIEIDWKIRDQSIIHQEKAIESCKLRVEKENTALFTLTGKEHDKLKAEIDDVTDMITEMQQRLADLRKPPVNVKEETEMKEQLAGVLGTLMGATKEEKEETLAKVVGGATDIGSMVKKKKKKVGFEDVGSGVGSAASTPGPEVVNGNGKRKVEFADEAAGKGKKARVEEVEDSGK